jgi:hypothetical protein
MSNRKSLRLQRLVSNTDEDNEEIHIHDIPGGPVAFGICAKFCYGMVFTLNLLLLEYVQSYVMVWFSL